MQSSGDERTVIDGPFAGTKGLVAGITIIQVKWNEEAIEWVRRTSNVFANGEVEVGSRRLMDLDESGDGFTPCPEFAKVKFR